MKENKRVMKERKKGVGKEDMARIRTVKKTKMGKEEGKGERLGMERRQEPSEKLENAKERSRKELKVRKVRRRVKGEVKGKGEETKRSKVEERKATKTKETRSTRKVGESREKELQSTELRVVEKRVKRKGGKKRRERRVNVKRVGKGRGGYSRKVSGRTKERREERERGRKESNVKAIGRERGEEKKVVWRTQRSSGSKTQRKVLWCRREERAVRSVALRGKPEKGQVKPDQEGQERESALGKEKKKDLRRGVRVKRQRKRRGSKTTALLKNEGK